MDHAFDSMFPVLEIILRKQCSIFNKWCWEKLNSHMQKNKTGPLSNITHKNQLKMD